MSDDSTNSSNEIQLSLWGDTPTSDKRPLPLIVAEKWAFKLAYIDQDSSPDNYLYAGLDWFRGLGGSRQGWSLLKNQLSISTRQLPYLAANGKTYQLDFLTHEQLYIIAMEMRPLKRRPQLDAIRDYLAQAGVISDKIRREPSWAVTRIDGMVSREQFTHALVTCVTDLGSDGIAIATNDVYRGLYHRTAAQLSKQLDTKNPRDKMTQGALHILGLCEWVCSQQIGEAQSISMEQARAVIQMVAGMLGLQVAVIEKQLGIDLATGKKLISSIDAIKGA